MIEPGELCIIMKPDAPVPMWALAVGELNDLPQGGEL
jgi:hypothetical protein